MSLSRGESVPFNMPSRFKTRKFERTHPNIRFLSALITLPLLAGCHLFETPSSAVIILTIDTLRVDHVSAFSPDSPAKTIHLDALAKDGIAYTQTYSPISVTGPAFVSLMTGMPLIDHNVTMNVFRGGTSLSDDEDTLAERFAESDYRTGAFVSGFTLRPSLGLDQGFDVYSSPTGKDRRRWGNQTASEAISWLKENDDTAFLWYHSYDAHGPWDRWGTTCSTIASTDEERQMLERIPQYQRIDSCIDEAEYAARYAKAVEFADKNVGRIIRALKKQGRYENALIIVTADHGESFTERELWFDHGTTAHEEQLHVPLIIKYPQNTKAGTIDDRLVSLLDIAPTILSVAELPPLPKAAGVSLTSSTDPIHTQIYGESSHCKKSPLLSCEPIGPKGKVFALRTTDTTIVQNGEQMSQYNRIHDTSELQPLPVYSPLGADLQQFSAERIKQVQDVIWPPPNKRSVEFQQLKQLGYVNE